MQVYDKKKTNLFYDITNLFDIYRNYKIDRKSLEYKD